MASSEKQHKANPGFFEFFELGQNMEVHREIYQREHAELLIRAPKLLSDMQMRLEAAARRLDEFPERIPMETIRVRGVKLPVVRKVHAWRLPLPSSATLWVTARFGLAKAGGRDGSASSEKFDAVSLGMSVATIESFGGGLESQLKGFRECMDILKTL